MLLLYVNDADTSSQIPEPDAAILSIAIDRDATYMAAVNNQVSFFLVCIDQTNLIFPSMDTFLCLV